MICLSKDKNKINSFNELNQIYKNYNHNHNTKFNNWLTEYFYIYMEYQIESFYFELDEIEIIFFKLDNNEMELIKQFQQDLYYKYHDNDLSDVEQYFLLRIDCNNGFVYGKFTELSEIENIEKRYNEYVNENIELLENLY